MGTLRVGEFEWDDGKARANVRKHGVTFEEAMTVFLDELAVPFEEGEHPDRLILVAARPNDPRGLHRAPRER